MDTPKQRKRVVILGAGFGGLAAAQEFARLKKNQPNVALDVTVIDRNDFQLFTPDLYEIASAAQQIDDPAQLKETVCLDLRMALKAQDIMFVRATVEAVDIPGHTLQTSEGDMVGDILFDYLVLALGSEVFYFGIPGMREHAIPFKTIRDAITIRKTIYDVLEVNKQAHVIVCGAGPAGVELAAELMHACKKNVRDHTFDMTIVDAQQSVLGMFHTRVQRAAARGLQRLGIQIKTNFLIARAERNKIISRDGEILEGDIIIWTGGVKASGFLEKTGLQLTKRGQIAAQLTLQTKERAEVFVVGDAAEVSVAENFSCPMTAHEAVHQGPVAARNIFNLIMHSENGCDAPLETYRMEDEGIVITLGGKQGIVALPGNIVLTGIVGWFVRKYVDFRHFRSVLPFMKACSIWFNGLKVMIKND